MDSSLKVGDYAPPKSSDTRSPCPAINALANHGYLPRSGRDVQIDSILNGLDKIGVGSTLAYLFSHPIFIERPPQDAPKAPVGWGTILLHPFNYLFSSFGMRRPGQKDSQGHNTLNLDQLGIHNVVEHDVSLTRHDIGQGDNISPQPELIRDLLAASSNGKTITINDFVALRKRRYAKQKEVNPGMDFSEKWAGIACAEIALILKVFGDGKEVPVSYVKAFFQDGRLPREEGWTRHEQAVGFFAMNSVAKKVQKALGFDGKGATKVVPAAEALK